MAISQYFITNSMKIENGVTKNSFNPRYHQVCFTDETANMAWDMFRFSVRFMAYFDQNTVVTILEQGWHKLHITMLFDGFHLVIVCIKPFSPSGFVALIQLIDENHCKAIYSYIDNTIFPPQWMVT